MHSRVSGVTPHLLQRHGSLVASAHMVIFIVTLHLNIVAMISVPILIFILSILTIIAIGYDDD